jgi:hypothetical protein
MVRILGILLAAIFALLSAVHIYWAFGGRFGGAAAVPTNAGGARLLNPSPLATILVAAALFVAMLAVLGRIRIWGAFLPSQLFSIGTWIIALLFLLRAIGDMHYVGFTKTVTDTTFARWDTILFSPLCLFITILALLISYYEAV